MEISKDGRTFTIEGSIELWKEGANLIVLAVDDTPFGSILERELGVYITRELKLGIGQVQLTLSKKPDLKGSDSNGREGRGDPDQRAASDGQS